MRVLVVQNDQTVPIGALGPPLRVCGIQLDVWAAWHEDRPAAVDNWGGVIVLGGAANPDQDALFDWLKAERSLLGQAIARQMPILGICLGAELLTQVIGGRVYRLPGPEIGWILIHTLDSAHDDPLWCTVPDLFQGFEWHGYGCLPPPGATVLATDREGLVEAFRYHDHIWALQFHIEADQQIIRDWISSYQDHLRSAGKDPATLASKTAVLANASRQQAFAVGRRFASAVERTAVRRGSA
jgi:GMP synthase (glutamine-hydrolysing)